MRIRFSLVPCDVDPRMFSQPFMVSLSNHERSHFDKLSANGSGR
jgi:hypothetical protein